MEGLSFFHEILELLKNYFQGSFLTQKEEIPGSAVAPDRSSIKQLDLDWIGSRCSVRWWMGAFHSWLDL